LLRPILSPPPRLANVLAVKDEAALNCCKKAASFATNVLRKYLQKKIEDIIDDETKVKHSELADQADAVFEDPLKGMKSKVKPDDIESCYTPIIMSGGKYDLKPSAESDDNELHYGTIICAVGARFKNYCANVVRTFFVNPSTDQKELYSILIEAYTAAKANLRPGKKVSDVYNAAEAVVKRRNPALLTDKNLTVNLGFGTGLEFRESTYVISAKNHRPIRPGMVFNLAIGFENVKSTDPEKLKDPKSCVYAIMLADTFQVMQESDPEPEVLTHCSRAYSEVSYEIGDGNDDDSDDSDDSDDDEDKKMAGREKPGERGKSGQKSHEQMNENQRRLEKKKRLEALEQFAKKSVESSQAKVSKNEKIASYKSPSAFPSASRPNRIFVDAGAESILVPVGSRLVPFHIATIKSVTKSEEGTSIYLRINFLVPTDVGASKPPGIADKSKIFIRELTFKTKATLEGLSNAYFQIREVQKRYKQRLQEAEVAKTIVIQEDLQINNRTGPVAKLRDVSIRPLMSRRKTTGILVAHENGFRYTSSDKGKLDIIYKNIKTAFFQPAENSVNVLLHFELHNGIMYGPKANKKTNYVQFYVEVVEASQDISQRSRQGDEDGLLEEQEERRRRQRQNERFHAFVKKVEDSLGKMTNQPNLEFDIPYRDLAFNGVPNRANVTIMPTVHSLVALDDNPPMVLSLNEIEICNFERVQLSLRNFDLAFVFKDYTKLPVRIDAIPSSSLERVKSWLNSCDILHYETVQNMVWKAIMKTVNEDPKAFFEDGGWSFLRAEGSDDEEEEESGSEFSAPESESESEDDYDSEDDSEVDEDESESDYGSGDGDEDEGEDWDEMEKKARRDDVEQGRKEREQERDEARRKPPKKKARK